MSQLSSITQMKDQLSRNSIEKIENILNKITNSFSYTSLSTDIVKNMLISSDRLIDVIIGSTNTLVGEEITIGN